MVGALLRSSSNERGSSLGGLCTWIPLSMRLSIEKFCSIRIRTPCHELLLALVLNGVRGGRRLNTCLVLRVEPNGLVTE